MKWEESVILINPFEIPEGREDECLSCWEKVAEYLHRQPAHFPGKIRQFFNACANDLGYKIAGAFFKGFSELRPFLLSGISFYTLWGEVLCA